MKAAEIHRLGRLQPAFQPGEPARHVLLVRSGFLRLVEPASGAVPERTVAVAGPWELAGEEGMDEGTRRYRCIAGEPATYQALEGTAVFHVLKSTRRTFGALLEGFARDLECTRHLATGSCRPSVRERLAYVLLDLARRWGRTEKEGVLVPHRVTHQVLADLAGAHRSTVTTTLNDWIYEGLLKEAERGYLLPRPRRLERMALSVREGGTAR